MIPSSVGGSSMQCRLRVVINDSFLCRWFIRAMQVENERLTGSSDVHSLSPYQIKELVYAVLTLNCTDAQFRSAHSNTHTKHVTNETLYFNQQFVVFNTN